MAQVKVLSVMTDPDEIKETLYDIHYGEVFKPLPTYSHRSFQLPKKISTGANSALCGIDLQVGKTYLIAGMRENGFLSANHCSSLNRLFSEVDANLLSSLRNGFI